MAEQLMISYRGKETGGPGTDGDGTVVQLARALEKEGYSVWFGENDLDGGGTWAKAIQSAVHILGCQAFLPLCSSDFGNTEWTFNEIQLAKDERKPFFPVWHSGIYPPEEVKIFLVSSQRIPGGMKPMTEVGLEATVKELVECLKRGGIHPVNAPAHVPSPSSRSSGSSSSLATDATNFLKDADLLEFAEKFAELGVKTLEHMKDVDLETLTDDVGCTKIQAKRFLRNFEKVRPVSARPARPAAPVAQPSPAPVSSSSSAATASNKGSSSGACGMMTKTFNAEGCKVLKTLEGHTDAVVSVAFSPDGALLATASGDNTAKLWRSSDWGLVKTLEGHTDWVNSVAFSPDGALLATASYDNTAKLWRSSDGGLVKTLEGHTDWVLSVAFSPDGALLATASDDNTAKLWWSSDGGLVKTLEGHMDSVRSVAFSPDGALLATASDDNTAKLWRSSDGGLVKGGVFGSDIIKRHMSTVWGVAFSPDGALLATASGDNTAKLWRSSDGRLVKTLEEHTTAVVSVAFSPDGALLATASGDNTAKLWG